MNCQDLMAKTADESKKGEKEKRLQYHSDVEMEGS